MSAQLNSMQLRHCPPPAISSDIVHSCNVHPRFFSSSVNVHSCNFSQLVQKFYSGTGSPGWSRKKGRKMVVVVKWFIVAMTITVFLSCPSVSYGEIHVKCRHTRRHTHPSHLNAEGDRILLAVHVASWFAYVCTFVANPRFALDCFLKTYATRIFRQNMVYVLNYVKLAQHVSWKYLH